MEFKIDSSRQVYRQLINQLRISILTGDLKPGEKLEAVRNMANEAFVNVNTLQRALCELENEGLLYVKRGNGRYVTEDRNLIAEKKNELGQSIMKEFQENMLKLGYSTETIFEKLEDELNNQGKDKDRNG